MAFHPPISDRLLVRAARCCCLCQQFKGSKMEIHHIVQEADGGGDDEDNGIPLCFDCHAEVNAYNVRHPRGRKYTPAELRQHRDHWFAQVAAGAAARRLAFHPEVRRDMAGRLNDRITEGQALLQSVRTIPGQWKEKWVKWDGDTHYRTPDEYVVDVAGFVRWTTAVSGLTAEMAAINPAHAQKIEAFQQLSPGKSQLEWGVAVLTAICSDLSSSIGVVPTAGTIPEKRAPAPRRKVQATVAGVVAGGDVTVHGDINVHAGSHRLAVLPGTVSEHPRMIGYLRYLVDRYNEFKRWECEQRGRKMAFGFIYTAYKRELKYDLRNTPVDRFEAGARYLQGRITRTVVGRIRSKAGQSLFTDFSSFDPPVDSEAPADSKSS
jgi:hypothetical protein